MMNLQLRLLLLALRTWSRLPLVSRLPDASGEHPAWLARSMRYAPLAGIAIALPAWMVYVFAGLWLPHAVAVLASIVAGLALGGALHERGLATAFELRAHATTPEARPGQVAMLCLAVLLLARFEILSSIDPSWIGFTLVCAAALSRGFAVLALGTLPGGRGSVPPPRADPDHTLPPTDVGAPAPAHVAAHVAAPASVPGNVPATAAQPPVAPVVPRASDVAVAAAGALLPLAAAILWTGDAGVFATAVVLCAIASAAGRRIVAHGPAGYTRAGFGTVQQLAELAFFVGMLATLSIVDETPADTSP